MSWDSNSIFRQLELDEDSRVEFKEAHFTENRVQAPHRNAIADIRCIMSLTERQTNVHEQALHTPTACNSVRIGGVRVKFLAKFLL